MINNRAFIPNHPIRALKVGYTKNLNGSLQDALVLFVCLH